MRKFVIALAITIVPMGLAYGQNFKTVITVDTTSDPTPGNNNTCSFNGPLAIGPANDGLCSLRRAMIEASLRPENNPNNANDPANQRPILIQFDLPANEQNSTTAGTWTITLSDGDAASIARSPFNITREGMVTVDGSTQPNGRDTTSNPSVFEGPSVFIDSDSPLTFGLPNITLKNIGIYGGASLQMNRLGNAASQTNGNHLVENIWMGLREDGQAIVLETAANPSTLAGGGIALNSDANIIRNNVVTGATGRAIDINSSNRKDNQILGNYIGTRGDGTVPGNVDCTPSFTFDPANWYGGEGLRVFGDNHTVSGNMIAGLNTLRSANDTPPNGLEIGLVTNVLVADNKFGMDATGNDVGSCGGAITASGATGAPFGNINEIIGNEIAATRPAFLNTPTADSAIFLGGSAGFTVSANIVRNATTAVIDFAPNNVPEAWRNFQPATITSIDGTGIAGTSGAASPCPDCIIEIYLDDADLKQEALVLYATVTADSNGDFTANLPAALVGGEGLRTISRTTANNTIAGFEAQTSSRMSALFGAEQAIFHDSFEQRLSLGTTQQ